MTDTTDLSRRHFLVAATVNTGGAGMVAAAVFSESTRDCDSVDLPGDRVHAEKGDLEGRSVVLREQP